MLNYFFVNFTKQTVQPACLKSVITLGILLKVLYASRNLRGENLKCSQQADGELYLNLRSCDMRDYFGGYWP